MGIRWNAGRLKSYGSRESSKIKEDLFLLLGGISNCGLCFVKVMVVARGFAGWGKQDLWETLKKNFSGGFCGQLRRSRAYPESRRVNAFEYS